MLSISHSTHIAFTAPGATLDQPSACGPQRRGLARHIDNLIAKVHTHSLHARSQDLIRATFEVLVNPTIENLQRFTHASRALEGAIERASARANPRLEQSLREAIAIAQQCATVVAGVLERKIEEMLRAMPTDPSRERLNMLEELLRALTAALAIIAGFLTGQGVDPQALARAGAGTGAAAGAAAGAAHCHA